MFSFCTVKRPGRGVALERSPPLRPACPSITPCEVRWLVLRLYACRRINPVTAFQRVDSAKTMDKSALAIPAMAKLGLAAVGAAWMGVVTSSVVTQAKAPLARRPDERRPVLGGREGNFTDARPGAVCAPPGGLGHIQAL